MDITAAIDNVVSLKATLAGIQRKFSCGLGIKRCVLSMHNNPKQALRAAFGSTAYPYGWFKCSTLSLDKERAALVNIARFGSGHTISVTDTSASVRINHYFPAIIQTECTIKFDQYEPALLFIQQVLLASAAKLLNFEIQMPSDKWTVEVTLDGDSIPLPVIDDLDGGFTPGSFDITFNLTVKTKVGFNRETAKINNQGEIMSDISLDTGEDLDADLSAPKEDNLNVST